MDAARKETSDAVTAGVVTRPPLLYLSGIVSGLGLDYLVPLPLSVPGPVRWMAGGGLILSGVLIAAAGIGNFARARTPVPSNQPARAMVTTGIHGWSRNPIYVGMFLLYGGIAVVVPSPWMLVLALPLAIVLRYGVVAREEAYMERRFGEAYRDYKARVRRWL